MQQAVLLFDSVLFTFKTLYECRLLKNGAIILRDVCDDLVNKQLLLKVNRGTGYSTKAVKIYIKALPNQKSNFEYQQFMMALASLGNSCVTMSSILESCKTIKYVSKKRPVEKIFEILNQPQYKILNLDLTPLYLDEMTVAANEVIDESVCDNEEFIEDQDIQTRSSSNFGIPTVSSIQYEHQTRLPRATF
ncbi:unnamed protein product [Rotaria magnacalcarata]|nr:unnamed protein product [Rotaria magnacalcarata]CAF4509573.1 unnamed protein product [Rotaria magnacalcarata]